MRIEKNSEIEQFFNRCLNNIKNEQKNRFLGMSVSVKNEKVLQRKMKKAGFQEFEGPADTWPSLFIHTEDFKQSPYHLNIHLDKINDADFQFSKETLPANQLFNVASIVADKNRELNDWMVLRALDQPYAAAVLWQGDDVWMLDAPSEANTMNPYAQKAHGHVVTFGLGIGYFIYMSLMNKEVSEITVIERSAEVVSMFKKYILPQFPQNVPVNIIEGDAFDYFNEEYINKFDYVFVDIWQSNNDGFLTIEKLLEQYNPPFEKIDFWIETSCFEFIPTLILLYFRSITSDFKFEHDNSIYNRVFQKISRYFDSIDSTVSDVHILKDFMYKPQVLREIVAISDYKTNKET